MFGAIRWSSGTEDANRQQRQAKANGHGKEGNNDQTTETKPQALRGKQRVKMKSAIFRLSHRKEKQRANEEISFETGGLECRFQSPAEQAFRPCRQRNTQARGKQMGNETRWHQLTLSMINKHSPLS